MADLFLERTFDAPVAVSGITDDVGQALECYGRHKVGWYGSHLSLDGYKVTCRFHAADAESVRIALRQMGADISNLWPGTIHDAPGTTEADQATANVLVARRFDAPVTCEDIQSAESAGARYLEAHSVRFLRRYFSLDRKRMLCLYRAPDAESVRRTQPTGITVEDVWPFTLIRPG